RQMGKPSFDVYEKFRKKYFALSAECGLEQYLVPYLMSSHPGSTLDSAVELAVCLKRAGYAPEQVQDYYPTPGTPSTVMYYTGINPLDGKKVYVATDYHEKQLQRALLQWNRQQNYDLVLEALKKCGREDLIGFSADCLIKPRRDTRPEKKGGAKPHVKAGAVKGKKPDFRKPKKNDSTKGRKGKR
ncbi:MAG: DUF3362 domain-containing protein, partial [Clostridia bacterium]|nr:DUF3362 domain-containing protein [Clostridia bacterium]